MKIRIVLRKVFTLKRVMIVLAVVAVAAAIATPSYLKHSRNEATIYLLQQIALAEMAMQPSCGPRPHSDYYGAYTDGVDETAEAGVLRMARFDFRPDPSVAFHIMHPGAINGVTPTGFVAFAAHDSAGSTVYTYNNFDGKGVVEAHEGVTYGGITVTSSVPTLYRYKYDPSTKTVEKMPNETKFGPDPKDENPARMVVTVVAE